MSDSIVIIGAGQAAIKAIETLRHAGYDGGIVLAGDESYPPYQRPPLSKAYLSGEMETARLFFKADDFYPSHNIELKLDTRATGIDAGAHHVSFADGSTLPYRKLLLATGARARGLPLPGATRDGVVTLRGIADVDRIRAHLKGARHLAVIGGGYIGLEVAAVARKRGLAVTVLEACERVMARVVSPQVSDFFETLHRGHGIDMHLGASIAAIAGNGRATGVTLIDGTTIPADLVLIAAGAQPNSELAAAAGLKVDDGILVDHAARTSAPDIHAAGDCSRFPSPRYGRMIRLESVQNAIDQAKVAALAMLGEEHVYDPVPWFWSDQYDVKLQIAGLSDGYDRTTLERFSETSFAVSYYKGERLIAVDTINAPRAHMLARRALAEDGANHD